MFDKFVIFKRKILTHKPSCVSLSYAKKLQNFDALVFAHALGHKDKILV